jgi:hypothetical protein
MAQKTITLKTLEDNTSNRCEQMVKMLLSNINERDPHKIVYPSLWSPQK